MTRRDFFVVTLVPLGLAAALIIALWASAVPIAGPIALTREGLALGLGSPETFDADELGGPTVIVDRGMYRMWYYGCAYGVCSIGHATSSDGRTWVRTGVVLSPALPSEGRIVAYPGVLKTGSTYRMWYSGFDGSSFRILLAMSEDGIIWTKQGVALNLGSPGSADDRHVFDPTVVVRAGTYFMYYAAASDANPGGRAIMLATSLDGVTWAKQGVVLSPGAPGDLDDGRVLDPGVVVAGNRFAMVYAGTEAATGLQRLFYADSSDGLAWIRRGLALDVEVPDESPHLSLPTIVQGEGGGWFVHYSARGTSFQIYLASLAMHRLLA